MTRTMNMAMIFNKLNMRAKLAHGAEEQGEPQGMDENEVDETPSPSVHHTGAKAKGVTASPAATHKGAHAKGSTASPSVTHKGASVGTVASPSVDHGGKVAHHLGKAMKLARGAAKVHVKLALHHHDNMMKGLAGGSDEKQPLRPGAVMEPTADMGDAT
jgi:hypothetical protein